MRSLGVVLLLIACAKAPVPELGSSTLVTEKDASAVTSAAPPVIAPPTATSAAVALPIEPEPQRSVVSCGGGLGTDQELRAARTEKATTIAALLANKPTSGRFTVEGFAQAPHHCGTCPPGASCKPCVDTVFFSEAKGAYKGPISEDTDLRVRVHDARKFETTVRYRVTIEVCSANSIELRGYQPL